MRWFRQHRQFVSLSPVNIETRRGLLLARLHAAGFTDEDLAWLFDQGWRPSDTDSCDYCEQY